MRRACSGLDERSVGQLGDDVDPRLGIGFHESPFAGRRKPAAALRIPLATAGDGTVGNAPGEGIALDQGTCMARSSHRDIRARGVADWPAAPPRMAMRGGLRRGPPGPSARARSSPGACRDRDALVTSVRATDLVILGRASPQTFDAQPIQLSERVGRRDARWPVPVARVWKCPVEGTDSTHGSTRTHHRSASASWWRGIHRANRRWPSATPCPSCARRRRCRWRPCAHPSTSRSGSRKAGR